MRLFIAEKPSLGQAIAHNLGKGRRVDGYFELNQGKDIVTWCFGHILEQLNPDEYDEKYKKWSIEDLPIIPSQWKLKITPSCKKQFNIIKSLIAKADEIVHAGDPDREGQLLIDEVLEFVQNKKPVQRLHLNALDEKSVKAALSNLHDNAVYIGDKNAALARSRADWLIGMNLSRAYTIKARDAGYASVVSVGRVQTPTMALVVRRENEIANFTPVNFYEVKVDWRNNNDIISTIWQPKDELQGLDQNGHLLKKDIAEALLTKIRTVSGYSHARISKIEQKEKQEPQRLPYSLSALQIHAGKRFGYSPQQVLDTMQELYEKKLTTYPRSDCDYLPENQFAEAPEILNNLKSIIKNNFNLLIDQANYAIRSRAWNDKKISAHHAIIPTTFKCDYDSLPEIQQNLYYMVAQAYLAQFFPIHTYQSTKVIITCSDETFSTTGKTILINGWHVVYKNEVNEENNSEKEKTLPELHEGDTLNFFNGQIIDKITKPPTRFNPSTLLKAMKDIYKYVKDDSLKTELKECSGIGTEATRAGIIDKLQTSGFLSLQKKYLVPTEKARMAVTVLPEDITYPDTTAVWEKELENISKQKISIEKFFVKQEKSLKMFLAQAENTKIKPAKEAVFCPNCKKPMIKRKGKSGKYFWACTGYPDCKTIAPDNDGKPDFSVGQISGLTAECPKCHGKLNQIKGKYGLYWKCENKDCNLILTDAKNKPVIAKCPTCHEGFLIQKTGKKGKFWSCNRYPECKTIVKKR
ncbi:DNA topoisomerase III [Pectinatus frisingensis]|uniref:DNA topoisomerase III n=1 Tax=Pectinatus frisingensis TaxID=865 RepID=UPI0018C61F81|nr:DNA topoisomerase III [Pectinatus frisingensis]